MTVSEEEHRRKREKKCLKKDNTILKIYNIIMKNKRI